MQKNKNVAIDKVSDICFFDEIIKKNEASLSKNLTKNDEQIAKLQGELSSEQDKRKEERFIWILVSAFFFNCFSFEHISWYVVLILFILELAILMIIAKWLGIEYAIKILKPLSYKLDKLIHLAKFTE